MSVPQEDSLPYGWKVITSKRHPDRVYYFNSNTGSTTWECPNLVPKDSKNDQVASEGRGISFHEKPQIKEYICEEPDSTDDDVSLEKYIPELYNKSRTKKRLNDNTTKTIPKVQSAMSNSTEDISKAVNKATAVVAPVVKQSSKINGPVLPKSSLKLQPKGSSFLNKRCDKTHPLHQNLKRKISNILEKGVARPSKRCAPNYQENPKRLKSVSNQDVELNVISKRRKEVNDIASTSSHKTVQVKEVSLEKENDKYMDDVEMLDVSEDLTKIADLAETTESFASYYIVVDTNVLISELTNIDEIKDTPIEGCGPPHIFIPWIVIQELDALKRSAKVTTAGRAAAEAVRYLNSVLKAKHPRFHGQSPQEAKDWAKAYSKNNDDKILECCMSLADKMPREKVILLTNDRNLANKALICDIVVHDWESMLKVIKTDVIFKGSKGSKKSKSSAASKRISSLKASRASVNVTQKRSVQNTSNPINIAHTSSKHKLLKQCSEFQKVIDNHMCRARQVLKEVLDPFLVNEMNDAYGKPWMAFSIERRYLKGLLDAIMKYWKTVFAFNFAEKDRRNFELLREKFSRPEGLLCEKEECLSILTTIENVFYQIQRRWPQMEVPVEKIQSIRSRCVELFLKNTDIENSITAAEHQNVLNVFEHNWAVINHLCGMVMDFYHIPHNFQYEKPAVFPAVSDFQRLMCNLYPGVQQMKQLMCSTVAAIDKSTPTTIYKRFHKALKEFVSFLEIKSESPVPPFSWEALKHFCVNPENKEMIQIGYKQLETFYTKLDEALGIMMSTKTKKIETMVCD